MNFYDVINKFHEDYETRHPDAHMYPEFKGWKTWTIGRRSWNPGSIISGFSVHYYSRINASSDIRYDFDTLKEALDFIKTKVPKRNQK
jgi:hypothetical protein